jgi:hypothetical protein
VANAFYTQALAEILSGDLDVSIGVKVYIVGSLEATGIKTFPVFDASHTAISQVTNDVGYLVTTNTVPSPSFAANVLDGGDMLPGADGWNSGFFPFVAESGWLSSILLYKGTTPIAWIDRVLVDSTSTGNVGLPVHDVAGNEIGIIWNSAGIFDASTATVYQPSMVTNENGRQDWYDRAVCEWCEVTLRDKLPDSVRLQNQFALNNGTAAEVNAPVPVSTSLAARPEGSLDERGHRPQHLEGVWIRVTDSVDAPGLAYQPVMTEHTLVLTVFATSTDAEDGTPPTTLPTGYKRVMTLAKAVADALVANLDCCKYGILNIQNEGGGRLPRALRGMPSTHVLTSTYTVLQKTHRPFGVV